MTLYKDIMPYFDKFIHVYDWNLGLLWSPFKIWAPQNVIIAKFGHPLSKSWLRPLALFIDVITMDAFSLQNPKEADAMTKIQTDLDETKIILVSNSY